PCACRPVDVLRSSIHPCSVMDGHPCLLRPTARLKPTGPGELSRRGPHRRIVRAIRPAVGHGERDGPNRRQLEREDAALARLGGDSDVASLETGELASEEEPESRALEVLCLGRDDPAEACEELRHAVGADAQALVAAGAPPRAPAPAHLAG